ncbi:MAG: hypothetical protein ACP5NS_04710 [Candidatus Pacearchaeota archaeon]
MLKKSILILLVLLLSGFVIAQSNSTNNTIISGSSTNVIDKAYQCLQTQVNNKDQSALSLQEAVFGILALGSNSKLVSVIDSKTVNGNHWAETTNQIKDTSQVLLAYKRIGKNTDQVVSWIESNKRTATELTWYLEIDIENHMASECTVTRGNEQRTISISEDMTLSGNTGSCLTIAQGGFWLRVSNSCIDQNYSISCDQDFVTSTLYQRAGSSTIFVSPTAHSAPLGGTTQESFNSKCFSTTSSGCDYEGTLWAALALDSLNKDISDYLPYLLALSESNQRYLPSSFLYLLTNGQDQYSQLVQAQQQSKYWQSPNTPNNRYYDSALAMLALQGTGSAELSNSQNYFESIVTPEGCWNNNNIRDTGFLLYSGWPRFVPSNPSGGGGAGISQSCQERNYACTSVFVCNDIGGSVYEDYDCNSGVCCSIAPEEQTCSAQNGDVCSSNEVCSGTTTQSSDGSCCLGSCNIIPEADSCELAGGECFSSCTESEEQIPESCSISGTVCCKSKETTSSSGTNWVLWIIILVILIAIVVAAIFFRNRLKLNSFKKNQTPSGYRQGIPPGGRPPFPPSRGPVPMRQQQRFIPSNNAMPTRRPGQSSTDSEMDETMRKLKEMSK